MTGKLLTYKPAGYFFAGDVRDDVGNPVERNAFCHVRRFLNRDVPQMTTEALQALEGRRVKFRLEPNPHKPALEQAADIELLEAEHAQ
jgi:hypothetical protein